MKYLKKLSLILLCLTMCLCLTSCFDTISFIIENAQVSFNNKYYSDLEWSHFLMLQKQVDELNIDVDVAKNCLVQLIIILVKI